MQDDNMFEPLEPAFLKKEFLFEDLPESSMLFVYVPVQVIEKVNFEFLKVETLQGRHKYLCHKDLLIKKDDIVKVAQVNA